MSLDYLSVRVTRVIEETADSRSLEFELPEALAERLRYRPGQFLTLRVPHQGGWLPRCYSLSSTPLLDEPLRVTIKRVRDGRASNWLCDAVQAGDTLQVLAPAGVFVPRQLDTDLLLFGGGSGITPVLSILRSALLAGTGRILLIYANRDEASVIFRDSLKALASAHPQRLQVIHWLDSVQGIASVSQLAELARPFVSAEAFICGPGPFMDAAVAALQALGMPSAQVHVERFVSLPEEGEVAVPAAVDTRHPSSQLSVRLDGEEFEVPCAEGETLLNAMRRAGLNPPSSCLVGSCATCMCTVERGEVQMLRNDALDQQEMDQGWTLACQSLARSEHLRVLFPE
ncbi:MULTISPECIES: ferredoxin--NADP reductase [Pseudomonas]|jgi:3-ketosteroid 9alpha-monooxygenase subunit B|uniref:3-ketosteroid 9alpha-hydroxylase component KshB n=1 Tax=Pseudomonas putida NBRC 14164 TaxID=1211579 RepID=A0ABM7EFD8_PSEPU|nr:MULTISPECIES: ferredoxin--NADP reductase [Pseudomonas]EKT4460278.1 ferredoxin--NADP reductase [Pseudomonas putida]EKT4555819.1 ferredoxin--NADP reductase [Pseudomonas putida]MCX9137026.1 ferredoxin--NADP reductase [Pseudomonas sp. DCB_PUT]MDD1970648.1 ferredoxin--NADP reductase [Pseudomonas putida]MDO1466242.1 ferredoxin--NADP reductase [Pseudomonas putida]